MVEVTSVARPDAALMQRAIIMRDLAAALSACIYQSLCDSETFSVKAQHRYNFVLFFILYINEN